MENKITMPRLAAMLALHTGKQKKLCEDFLREIFAMVTDELASGESIRIKGFGTFKIVEVEARRSVNVATGYEHIIPAHGKVLFVASKELAEKVNVPFGAFEAVEISDSIPTDVLDALDAKEQSDADDEEVAAGVEEESERELILESAAEAVEDEATSSAYQTEDGTDYPMEDATAFNHEVDETVAFPVSEEVEGDVTQESGSQAPCYTDEDYEDSPRRGRFGIGFLAGFLTALVICGIGLCIGYYFGYTVQNGNEEKLVSAEMAPGDTLAESTDSVMGGEDSTEVVSSLVASPAGEKDDVPTNPSDSQVYDTVSTTRYLTTIAKEHYGNFNLWPIIYEENAKILGHPDRIKPGTRVVVPPLSKYGVDPKNKDQIKAIKQKGVEIYTRFK